MKLSDAIMSITQENKWTCGIICIGHLATASVCAIIIQNNDY